MSMNDYKTIEHNDIDQMLKSEASHLHESWNDTHQTPELSADNAASEGETRSHADTTPIAPHKGRSRWIPLAAAAAVLVASVALEPVRSFAQELWSWIARTPQTTIIVRPDADRVYQRDSMRIGANEIGDRLDFNPAVPTTIPGYQMDVHARVWYPSVRRLLTPFTLRDQDGETVAVPVLVEQRLVDGQLPELPEDSVPADADVDTVPLRGGQAHIIRGGWSSDEAGAPYEQTWTDNLVQVRWRERNRVLSIQAFAAYLTDTQLLELAAAVR